MSGTQSTISGSLSTGITLTSAVYTDPVTIAAGAVISGTGTTLSIDGTLTPEGDAVYAATPWTIENDGGVSVAALHTGTTVVSVGTIVPSGPTVYTNHTYGTGYNSGIYLKQGQVLNAVSASIYGGYIGIEIAGAAGTIVNEGSIAGNNQEGVYLTQGGYVSNAVSGTIYSQNIAVKITDAVGTVVNQGSIVAADFSYGIFLGDGGRVTDGVSGSIYGHRDGVYIADGAGTVVNQGSIGAHNSGVLLTAGGIVTNEAGGTVTGYVGSAIQIEGAGTVDNQGRIISGLRGGEVSQGTGVNLGGASTFSNEAGAYDFGSEFGVQLGAGSEVINAASATIYGALAAISANGAVTVVNQGAITGDLYGVRLTDGGTVINAGVLSAGNPYYKAIYSAGGNLTVELEQGSSISGYVVAAYGGTNVLELASVSGTGTLNGIGSTIENFTTIQIDPNAKWTLSGNVNGLANPDNHVTITGFAAGDSIDLIGVTFAGQTSIYKSQTGYGYLELSNPNGNYYIDFSGLGGAPTFSVSDDGNGGTDIVLGAVTCFCRGTLIRTDRGEVVVEALAIGDQVVTAYGAAQKIKWIGRRGYDGRFIKGNHLALPVCIKADAIADGVPSRDLFVSPGHGMFVDGVLVPAWRLINGVSITQAEAVERVEYFHIELEEHDIILAENCPAESFLDLELRSQFQNVEEFGKLYPDAVQSAFALPRVDGGFLLQSIHRHLAIRAGVAVPTDVQNGSLRGYVDLAGPEFITGWAQNINAPESPACLDILLDGKRIGRVLANEYRADLREAGLGSGCHAFAFKCPVGIAGDIEVRCVSGQAELPFTEALSGVLLAQAA